jgi:Phage minor structural protein GP20
MTKTGPVISSLLLPRHLGGPLMHFDEPTPPGPPPPPPPPPPAPPVHHAPPPPAPPPAPQGQRIEDVRAEAAGYRIEARTANEKLEAANRDRDRIQQEADARVRAAEQAGQTVAEKIKTRTRDATLRAEAAAAGLADLELLPLIDVSKVTVDDEGNVIGAVEAIAAFKEKKPTYFQPVTQQPPPPPPRTGFAAPPVVPGAPPPPAQTARTMPKADYEAARRAATASLKG